MMIAVVPVDVAHGSLPPNMSALTVTSQLYGGSSNSGMYAALYSNNLLIARGFTPAQFVVNDSQSYVVLVDDYGSLQFFNWQDTGSAGRYRAISISSNTTISAVYVDTNGPLPSGYSRITVSTVDSNGGGLTGYYSTLWQNAAMLRDCFSPCSFFVSNAQSYQVAVADFGSEAFAHWSDGNTNRFYTVSVGSDSTTIGLTAIYSP